MGKFQNIATGVVVSVADSKDGRFSDGWVSADAPASERNAKRGRPKKGAGDDD